jgi:uncharacterized membrane protein (DUF485 family)
MAIDVKQLICIKADLRRQALIRQFVCRAAYGSGRMLDRNMGRQMTPELYQRVQSDRRFQELVAKRTRFAWTLSATMLAIYFGFIFIIAFAPKLLAVPIGKGVTTVGIPIGLLVIVSAFILTGIYVRRANSEFDALTHQIVEETK